MNKTTVVVSCPIDTYSGYGARSRDFIKALLALEKYEVKVLSQRWGNTRFGYLADHQELELQNLILNNLQAQPDVWIQITVPNEFKKTGKFNIGLTAGIETTLADASWIRGCNMMDLVLTSSQHSKDIFLNSSFDTVDKNTNKTVGKVKLETPIEVIFEGADITKYFPTIPRPNSEVTIALNQIKESFCFLFVGHWLQGDFGHDRKNVGYTVKSFLEIFKNKPNPPALILKTNNATTSLLDREEVLDKIESIKSTVKGSLPNIYLFHGDITDEEVNELYNHPKVKAMVSFTKGEGFGRPLLEFSLSNKPIISSGWSGQLDFLDKDLAILVGGTLTDVHKSALSQNTIIETSKWFTPDDGQAANAIKNVYKNYKNFTINAKKLGFKNRTNFSLDKMTEELGIILERTLPEFTKQIELNLPKLNLPKLQTNG
tara:strand:+ start:5392 stop:6681 length:1290 start_codon:yes stop_codon:yes gene_type:complete